MLTQSMHRLLGFISSEIERNGYPPSFDEMKEAMGLIAAMSRIVAETSRKWSDPLLTVTTVTILARNALRQVGLPS